MYIFVWYVLLKNNNDASNLYEDDVTYIGKDM